MNLAVIFGSSTALASIETSGLIQLGSIIAGAAIVIVAGLFTIRAKNAEWWQQSYEGAKAAYSEEKERAEKLDQKCRDLSAENASLKALPNYDLVVGMLKRTMDDNKAQSEAQVEAITNLTKVIEDRLPKP